MSPNKALGEIVQIRRGPGNLRPDMADFVRPDVRTSALVYVRSYIQCPDGRSDGCPDMGIKGSSFESLVSQCPSGHMRSISLP